MKPEFGILAAALGVAAGGCMMEVGEPGLDGVYEDDVAVSTSELSDVRTRGNVTADRFLGVVPGASVFYSNGTEFCATKDELILDPFIGAFDPLTFEFCGTVSRVASNNVGPLFYADFSQNDIGSFRGDGSFTKLADTDGDARGIFVDASHVYWADNTGLRKVSRDGGAVTTLSFDGSLTLLALRGTTLYYSKALLNQAHQLRRMPTGGGNSTSIVTYTSAAGFKDFAVDSSAMYWVDNTQPTKRIRRLSHALGAAMTTVISDTADTYALPTPGPNGMHFVEWDISGGAIKIRRVLNGAITDQYQTLVDIVGMLQDGNQLRWVEEWPSYYRVKHASTL